MPSSGIYLPPATKVIVTSKKNIRNRTWFLKKAKRKGEKKVDIFFHPAGSGERDFAWHNVGIRDCRQNMYSRRCNMTKRGSFLCSMRLWPLGHKDATTSLFLFLVFFLFSFYSCASVYFSIVDEPIFVFSAHTQTHTHTHDRLMKPLASTKLPIIAFSTFGLKQPAATWAHIHTQRNKFPDK